LPTLKPTRAAIALEIVPGLLNTTGSIAMARTSAPNSATSQFFLNLANNTPLDGSYAVLVASPPAAACWTLVGPLPRHPASR
jgi:cyclophilin family peptidyl-prolyl cis-trans isomerase